MMKIKKLSVLGIILLFIGTSINPSTAQDTTNPLPTSGGKWWYVGGSGPGNYSIIQDAVDNASDGDTVFVYDDSSPYYHPIVIKKSICLMGEDKDTTIIDMRKREIEAIKIDYPTNNVIITGFTIQNTTWGGINVLDGCCYINISNNNILYNDYCGICLNEGCDYNVISGNIIRFQTNGIYATLSFYNTIKRNTFSDLDYGLLCAMVRNWHIEQNNFLNNKIDVSLYVEKYFWQLFPLIIHFDNNYWSQVRTFPKLIVSVGLIFFIPGLFILFLPVPIINIDWHPATTPFDTRV